MKFTTAWIFIMITYAIDILIITPYALFFRGMTEVGTVCGWGFYKFGYIFFPVWMILLGIILWFTLKFYWWLTDKLCSPYTTIARAMICGLYAVIIGDTIWNNLVVLL